MSFFIGENGSPNIPLIVGGIGLIALIVWKFFFSNNAQAGFGLKFSALTSSFQTLLNTLFGGGAGSLPVLGTYGGEQTEFSASQIPSGSDFQGIVLSSVDGSVAVYLNYYEYWNWAYAGTTSVLSVPMRTLNNGVITDMANGGFSIQGGLMSPAITYLDYAVTAGLVDSNNITLPISSLPTPPAS